ncbi:MAG: NADH-quinone oxidoreductase subunit C, partial [Desulfosarcinaceae bacterium]
GPGMTGIRVRGTSATPPDFMESRSDLMWTPPAARVALTAGEKRLIDSLAARFGEAVAVSPHASDMATLRVAPGAVKEILRHLKNESTPRFQRLDDLTAVDNSARRQPAPTEDFTVVYHLLALEPATRLRVEVPLKGQAPEAESVTDIWPSADWYEREAYDLMGVQFNGHPNLRRIIMPPHWEGHPLRKSFPGRATEMAPYTRADAERLQPPDAGIWARRADGSEEMLLNVGPHHVSTHGLIRYILALNGEEIKDIETEIGYHHRAVEKIGERQTTSPARPTTCPMCWRWKPWPGSKCPPGPSASGCCSARSFA